MLDTFKETVMSPVISAVPNNSFTSYTPKEKKTALSQYARKALFVSAEINRFSLKELKKDERGATIPYNGIHWSLSHKSLYVAAVCSKLPIGIDIEQVYPRSRSLFNFIADESEWEIAGEKNWDLFFRIFTAKEAAVKVTGEGLKDLKKCKLKYIVDSNHLVLHYREKEWPIEHFRIDQHISSITSWNKAINWKVCI